MFNKYSSSALSRGKKQTFDQRKHISEQINVPELWKFVKEHRLNNLIRQGEVKRICGLLTTSKGGNWGTLNKLNFVGFNWFVV